MEPPPDVLPSSSLSNQLFKQPEKGNLRGRKVSQAMDSSSNVTQETIAQIRDVKKGDESDFEYSENDSNFGSFEAGMMISRELKKVHQSRVSRSLTDKGKITESDEKEFEIVTSWKTRYSDLSSLLAFKAKKFVMNNSSKVIAKQILQNSKKDIVEILKDAEDQNLKVYDVMSYFCEAIAQNLKTQGYSKGHSKCLYKAHRIFNEILKDLDFKSEFGAFLMLIAQRWATHGTKKETKLDLKSLTKLDCFSKLLEGVAVFDKSTENIKKVEELLEQITSIFKEKGYSSAPNCSNKTEASELLHFLLIEKKELHILTFFNMFFRNIEFNELEEYVKINLEKCVPDLAELTKAQEALKKKGVKKHDSEKAILSLDVHEMSNHVQFIQLMIKMEKISKNILQSRLEKAIVDFFKRYPKDIYPDSCVTEVQYLGELNADFTNKRFNNEMPEYLNYCLFHTNVGCTRMMKKFIRDKSIEAPYEYCVFESERQKLTRQKSNYHYQPSAIIKKFLGCEARTLCPKKFEVPKKSEWSEIYGNYHFYAKLQICLVLPRIEKLLNDFSKNYKAEGSKLGLYQIEEDIQKLYVYSLALKYSKEAKQIHNEFKNELIKLKQIMIESSNSVEKRKNIGALLEKYSKKFEPVVEGSLEEFLSFEYERFKNVMTSIDSMYDNVFLNTFELQEKMTQKPKDKEEIQGDLQKIKDETPKVIDQNILLLEYSDLKETTAMELDLLTLEAVIYKKIKRSIANEIKKIQDIKDPFTFNDSKYEDYLLHLERDLEDELRKDCTKLLAMQKAIHKS